MIGTFEERAARHGKLHEEWLAIQYHGDQLGWTKEMSDRQIAIEREQESLGIEYDEDDKPVDLFAKKTDEFIATLHASLDQAAAEEFGDIEQKLLHMAMTGCGMTEYPPVAGDEHGERCSGEMICEKCGQDYYHHPADWRVIGYGNVPFLNVLCSGERVKL